MEIQTEGHCLQRFKKISHNHKQIQSIPFTDVTKLTKKKKENPLKYQGTKSKMLKTTNEQLVVKHQ